MDLQPNVDVFETSVRHANDWVREVMVETGLDQGRALAALRGVLHAIRDETTVRQSSYLVSGMPAPIRGMYFDGWDPSRAPAADHDARRFTARVRASFGDDAGEIDYARVVRGVFHMLDRRMPEAAVKIKRMLPRALNVLWPVSVADEVVERKERLAGEKQLAAYEALHAQAGHERGAPMAPHQNRPPGEQHRGGPLPNTM
jgi:uncharacterized protein (DUF2267 family)